MLTELTLNTLEFRRVLNKLCSNKLRQTFIENLKSVSRVVSSAAEGKLFSPTSCIDRSSLFWMDEVVSSARSGQLPSEEATT